jgi:aspartate/methionine/tyrosine aminotransferase
MNPQAQELNSLIQEKAPSFFSILSKKGKHIFFPSKGILGQSSEAKGKDINATIGMATEDDGSPMRLKSVEAHVTISPEDAFPYAPSFGRGDIREKWRGMIYDKNPSLKTEISLPVVTNALTHGLTLAGYMFADEGDEILVPDLFWGNYRLIFENMYDVKLSVYETFTDTGYNVAGLSEKLSSGSDKKIVLLNFPNNPTGYTPTPKEMKEISSCLKKAADAGKHIVVLCDDSYFGLVYEDNVAQESIFTYIAGIHENITAVKIDGATKEDYVWGFRVGFITIALSCQDKDVYDAVERKIAGAIRGMVSNVSNFSQSIVYKAFCSESYVQEKSEKFELLKSRYMEVKKALSDTKYEKYFTPLPFNSGYFMCIKIAEGYEAEAVRKKLLEAYSTGVIATGSLLRIAFSSLHKEQISQLFNNIFNACEELS